MNLKVTERITQIYNNTILSGNLCPLLKKIQLTEN